MGGGDEEEESEEETGSEYETETETGEEEEEDLSVQHATPTPAAKSEQASGQGQPVQVSQVSSSRRVRLALHRARRLRIIPHTSNLTPQPSHRTPHTSALAPHPHTAPLNLNLHLHLTPAPPHLFPAQHAMTMQQAPPQQHAAGAGAGAGAGAPALGSIVDITMDFGDKLGWRRGEDSLVIKGLTPGGTAEYLGVQVGGRAPDSFDSSGHKNL